MCSSGVNGDGTEPSDSPPNSTDTPTTLLSMEQYEQSNFTGVWEDKYFLLFINIVYKKIFCHNPAFNSLKVIITFKCEIFYLRRKK